MKQNIDKVLFDMMNDNAEFIPLLTPEDEEKLQKEEVPEVLPILTLRNNILLPGVVIPISAGRDQSIQLIEDAEAGDKIIGVVAQKNAMTQVPGKNDIYPVGTVARIQRIIKMPDGNLTVILQGVKRFKIDEVIQEEPYIKAKITTLPDAQPDNTKEIQALMDSIKELAKQVIQLNPNIPTEATFAIDNIESPVFLVNFVTSNMEAPVEKKQVLLETDNFEERALGLLKLLDKEVQRLELKQDIQNKTRKALDKQSREYFLHQEMRTIQEELGDAGGKEIEEMRKRAKKKKWKKEVAEHFEKELKRMQRMNPQAPDYAVQRNYLELMLDLPWDYLSEDKIDLKKAQEILDRDHFGLEDVKKRIIEYLAVLKIKNDMKSPILCLYGPPGVGKTSLGKSIAEAVGRKYVRMSLGGLKDEAEIRGHRKTYIGAMPGRIIQSIKKAGTSNPVFILDEIDKLGYGHKGDPSSAMLEVLDPEQNSEFYDNFLEVGYDLSRVMFIATANYLYDIPWALRDRMEIIPVTGYTIEEKVEIAKRHLLPKQIKEHGLTEKDVKIGKKQLRKIIENYTRESGVRTLDKMIAKVIRNVAKHIAMEEEYNPKLSFKDIEKILGKPRFSIQEYEGNNVPGVVTGLAWTRVGGDILFIESILSKGKGQLNLTGNLGQVMKESAQIALSYIKSKYDKLGVDAEVFEQYQIHLHVPEGATPKDGPSAGITMITSMVSALTGRKVKPNIAMTGEITLRGKVLPVGGIKEKILAAKRAKIKEIILSEKNKKDIEEINQDYIKGLTFHFVDKVEDVLDLALLPAKQNKKKNAGNRKEISGKE